MQKADSRIEAHRLGGGAAIMRQKCIKEGKQGVDRIERWPARAPPPAHRGVRRADEMIKDAKIEAGRLALGAAQGVEALAGQFDPPRDPRQPLHARGDGMTRLRRLIVAAWTCSTWPSAVNRFSAQSRSRWISAACRMQ
jgi:hypothetical protein